MCRPRREIQYTVINATDKIVAGDVTMMELVDGLEAEELFR